MQIRAALRQFFTAGAPGTDSDPSSQRGWRAPAARRMFWVGLAVRVLYITLAHTYRFRTSEDHFPYGWEMGRIARSLATGHGFANPFGGNTGPTAWTPPLYPLLMAACFRLFGVYSNLSAWFLLSINSVFSAATAPAIFEVADRCYGNRPDGRGVALWSGWLWALYPAALQYAVHWPWDMALTTWLFSMVLVLGLRLRKVGSPAETPAQSINPLPWAALGLFWGLIALSNSSLLTFLPIQAVWILWPSRHQLLHTLRPALLGAAVFLACIGPWILRNERAFHAFVPLRGNFGAELYMSALPSHEGFPWGTDIPTTASSRELRQYAQLGELNYSRLQGQRGKALIAADPGRFVRAILLRVQFFWAGVPHPYDHGVLDEFFRQLNYSFLSVAGLLGLALSLHRRVPAAGLSAAAFAVLPLIYYAITVQARFRHPLEPLITVFSVYLFRNADRSRVWSFRRAPGVSQQVSA
ncbi:MAG TPA: hypothetical protein VKV02_08135 [Acidobacteriaceae bacterium]|nr:hypothetical protein [Acidobacteriaceae bacterium]